MERTRPYRQESARNLVLALRTGFETREPFAQAVFDALVIAGLEMQPFDVLAATPVAPVKCRRAAQQ